MARSLTGKIAFNTVVQIAGKVVTVFFALLTTVLLVGYLGKTGFGDYIYVITLLILFGCLADWGTSTIGAREAAKNPSRQAVLLGQFFLFKAVFSFLAVIGLLLFLPRAVIWMALFLLFKSGRDFLAMVWQARLQMHKTAIVDMIASGLILFISWLFVRLGLGVDQLLFGYLLATVLALGAGIFLMRGQLHWQFSFQPAIFKPLLGEVLPMGAILLMFTIDNKIDTLMLGIIKGSDAVGIYGLAYRVYDVLILGAAFLMNALLPVFARWGDVEQWGSKLRQTYQKAFDILLVGGFLLAATVYWLAPVIIGLLTRQRFVEFAQAVEVMRLLTVAVFLAYLNHLTGYTIVALGKQRPYFLVALSALIFNVTANLVVMPRFSYYGAAVVTIFTEALVLLITTVFIFKLLHFVPSLVSFPRTLMQLTKQAAKNVFLS